MPALDARSLSQVSPHDLDGLASQWDALKFVHGHIFDRKASILNNNNIKLGMILDLNEV